MKENRRTVGGRLRLARVQLGISLEEFAAKVGVSAPTISGIETDARPLQTPLSLAIEYRWGVSSEWLEAGKGAAFTEASGLVSIHDLAGTVDLDPKRLVQASPSDFEYVPILAAEAAAGLPRVVDQEHVTDTAVIHKSWLGKGRHVCIPARGDSMSPRIEDGFVLCVNLDRTEPGKLIGQIVVAQFWDGITVKYLSRDRDHFLLVPENRAYSVVLLDSKDTRIVGAVEWWFGKPNK